MYTKHRNGRHQGRGFNPDFTNILNEIFNSPIHDVVNDTPKQSTYPASNIIKIENGYMIEIALPGVAKEKVDISINEGKLKVKAIDQAINESEFKLREFDYSSFERTFRLPKHADSNLITAKFEMGILTITVPNAPQAEPKIINVQ